MQRAPHSDQSPRTLYGITLDGDFPFRAPLPACSGSAAEHRLTITTGDLAPTGDWFTDNPVFASEVPHGSELPFVTLFHAPAGAVLRFPRAGDYFLGESRIHFVPASGCDWVLAEIHLLGVVLSLWLERRGIPVLHAAVAEVEGAGAAFLATNRGGKTSLAASLMRAGGRLVSDDLLVLHRSGAIWTAQPGYPQMRMWPDQASHFHGDPAVLEPVYPSLGKLRVPVGEVFGGFHPASVPLRALYLPERREEGDPDPSIRLEAASPAAGLIELVRHSFLTRMLHSAGLQSTRFPLLAELARSLPIRRLSYPTGVEHLPAVAAAVIRDLGAA